MAQTDKASDGLRITVSAEAEPEVARFIHERIKAFNDAHSEAHREARAEGLQPLTVVMHD